MEASLVLDRIYDCLRQVDRLFADNGELVLARQLLTSSLQNLRRIESMISSSKYQEISLPMMELLNRCPTVQDEDSQQQQQSGNAELERGGAHSQDSNVMESSRLRTGRRGRPRVAISIEELNTFIQKGYTARRIAAHYHCSTSFIYKKLYESGIKIRQSRYSSISTEELNNTVMAIHKESPNSGAEMLNGYLRSQGTVVQRARVRESLVSVDPASSAKRWSRTVARRVYSVAQPNSLWHMDGHMKLNRWGFTIHGCIDGFSRVVTFLKCGLSNSAEHPLRLFAQATIRYGIPARVRSDHGGENMQVAMLMNLVRGINQRSHITGLSVHNQRIERLWKDVFKEVVEPFYNTFYLLEDEEVLCVDDQVHVWSLQFTYLQSINERLESFRNAWNDHRIRTANNKTPNQIWIDGMLEKQSSDKPEVAEVFDTNSSLESLINESVQRLAIPEQNQLLEGHERAYTTPASLTLTDAQIQDISLHIINFPNTRDKYIACVEKVKELINL